MVIIMENYEQKYKEALERARSYYNNEEARVGMTPIELEEIFPELGENEDEKIRKEIIAFIKKRDRSGCDYDYDKWIAWLEKQSENLKQENYKTTICGKDYKCIKNYKVGNCSYSKGNVYHCGRDGYLIDDNGISWSCSATWCKEHLDKL